MKRSRRMEDDPAGHEVTARAASPNNMPGRRFWVFLIAIYAAGAAARVLILLQYWTENPFARSLRSDALAYWTWAGRIAAGQWREPTPFLSAPLYPYLLGLIRYCGGGLLSVYVMQIGLDLLSAAWLAWIGRRRYGAGVGLLSAAIFLFMFEPASFGVRILGVSLQMALVCAAWIALAAFQHRRTWAAAAISGFVLGVNCLATPAMMLILPFAIGWMWWTGGGSRPTTCVVGSEQPSGRPTTCVVGSDRQERWRSGRSGASAAARTALPGLIGAALAIAPATLHNLTTSGEFIPISAHGGITIYQGNVAGAQWGYSPVPGISREREQMHVDTARVFAQETGRSGTWGEIDRYFMRKTLASWGARPLETLKRMGLKAYAFLTARNYGDVYNPELETADGLSRRFNLAPLRTAWLMPLALLAVAFWLRSPREKTPELLFFLGPLVVVALFWYSPRYRAPAIPVVAMGAAWTLWQGWPGRRTPAWSIAAVGAVTAAVVTGLVNRGTKFDSAADQRAEFESSVGIALAGVGKFDQATERFREALRSKPGDITAMVAMANALREQGQLNEAISLARQVIASEPESAGGHVTLGLALIDSRAVDEAVREFQEAIRINPTLEVGHTNLGNALSRQGRLTEALQHHRTAAALNPSSALVQYNLACTLMRTKALDEAIATFQRSIHLDPSFAPTHPRLAPLLIARGRYAEAMEVLRQGCRLSQDDLSMANDLARLLAASPEAATRNGPEALRLATRNCERAKRQDSKLLDTLAAAYAETGDFARAAKTATEAMDLANAAGQAEQARAIGKRLALYQQGQPFRESPPG